MSERDEIPVTSPPVPASAPAPAPAPARRPVREVRLTDSERDAAQERLRQALDLGALDLDEYGDRYALVLSARSRGELAELTADLPVEDLGPTAATLGSPREATRGGSRWLVAVMGGHEERGSWDAGERIHAVAMMGGVDADLRHAAMAEHLVIDATALMGGIDIVVPDGAEVRMSGFALMGGRGNTAHGPRQPGAPLIEVKAFALLGGIDVRHANRKERERAERDVADGRLPGGPTVRRGAAGSGSTALAPTGRVRASWWRRMAAKLSVSTLVGLAALSVPVAVLGPVQDRAVMGSTVVDTTAVEPGQEPNFASVGVLMGSATVIVPDGARVAVSGFAFMGSRDCEACEVSNPDGEVMTVNGRALMGSVEIVTQSQYRADQGNEQAD